VTPVPRIIGWLPIIAVALAAVAALLWRRARSDAEDGSSPSPLLAVMPFALLFVAAATAVVSSAAEAVIDSRVGVREASMLGIAALCATPAIGWLLTRLRWGAPGQRTFHQQIAANRAGATVLVIVLGELLAVTGFVVGATFGAFVGAAFAGGLVVGALSIVGALVGGVVGLRRGPGMLLDAVHARPAGDDHAVLRNVVAELSIAAGMPAPRVFVIDDPAPNALALGSDPQHAAIAVTTGLLARLDREELQGVIAHELAHIRNFDSRYGLLVAVFVGAVILLAAVFAAFMSNWSIESDSISGVLMAIVIAVVTAIIGFVVRSVATAAALAIQASVSREREFLADASSVEITRNPAGLIGALAKIDGRTALGGVTANTRHLWFVSPLTDDDTETEGWRSTHPLTSARIARLHALSAQLDATEIATGVVASEAPQPAVREEIAPS
jgi:heat shock protein HtpX